ncbi:lipoprotein [Geobacter sp. DSM 9736]|uniref:LPS translocon maturation chaperone LptM n=1 Tax=Geobacter sp. DSM 9736 TaxID=1277350 RepID=UPI000B508551|nr:lipoprotein [Geobacter sp. DSM 9736]SNB47228.1 hypothetical protein SAMN06269301_2706 [Geobacter sp. DSM 9736]
MNKLIIVLLISLVLSGCGRKGQLIPPEALVPAPISDLRVAQQGEKFLVSWSPPLRDEGGRKLGELGGFLILRRVVLPPKEDCEQCPNAYHLLKRVDLDYLQDVTRLGALYFLSDPSAATGTTYQYKALSVKADGTVSRDSNKARRKKVSPPPPPRIQVRFTPVAAVLQWEPVTLHGEGTTVGYNVYRRKAAGSHFPVPLNDTPITEPRFEDTAISADDEYVYLVRTVARIDGEIVESESSGEVTGRLLPTESEE